VGGAEAISVAGLGGGRPEVGRGVQGQAATMAGRCHLGSWRSGAVAALGRGGEDRQGRAVSARAEARPGTARARPAACERATNGAERRAAQPRSWGGAQRWHGWRRALNRAEGERVQVEANERASQRPRG